MHVPVALVLNSDFGDRVAALAQKMPVWVVSSPANDHAVHMVRASLGEGRVTTLRVRPGEGAADLLARALYAIDEHHGEASQPLPYDTLWVHGTTERLPQDLVFELGFKSIIAVADGFRAEK